MRVFEALVDLVPVNRSPPGGEIVRPLVLVLEVVGMLPDVVGQDGVEALRQGRILVGSGDDFELAAGQHKPAPAGTELLGRGFVEGLLEGLEVAEVVRDLLGDGA